MSGSNGNGNGNGDPSKNGKNGRGPKGRFLPGNPGGPGNPHARAVARFRSRVAEVITVEDMDAVLRELVAKAKAGESWAVKEFLDRTLGKSKETVAVEGDAALAHVLRSSLESLMRRPEVARALEEEM